MKFMNDEHKQFYKDCMLAAHASDADVYRSSLFYTLGLSETTRRIINDLYDWKNGCIRPEGIHNPAQTGSSIKLTRLAFNLFTDCIPEDSSEAISEAYTPVSIFSCSLMSWMLEAVRIRVNGF